LGVALNTYEIEEFAERGAEKDKLLVVSDKEFIIPIHHL